MASDPAGGEELYETARDGDLGRVRDILQRHPRSHAYSNQSDSVSWLDPRSTCACTLRRGCAEQTPLGLDATLLLRLVRD